MRQLGAIWRESKHDVHKRPSELHEMMRGTKSIHFGWPSDGEVLWTFAIDQFEVSNRSIPVSLIYNAITLDEKCEMIKLLGGKLLSDPKKSPILDLAE